MNHGFRERGLRRTIVLVIATVFVAGGCSLPFEWAGSMPDSWDDPTDQEAGTQVVTVSGTSFTLAWDSGSAPVTGYRIYSRRHGAPAWQVIAHEVSAPQLTITEGDLPYGLYEFAVSSLGADGEESVLHHSYDPTADPNPWILDWQALR